MLAFETLSDPQARERYDRHVLRTSCRVQHHGGTTQVQSRRAKPHTRPRPANKSAGKQKRKANTKSKCTPEATKTASGKPEPPPNSSTCYSSTGKKDSVGPTAYPHHKKLLRHITVRIFDLLQRVRPEQRRALLMQEFTHAQRVAFETSVLEARRESTFDGPPSTGAGAQCGVPSTSPDLELFDDSSSSSSKDSDDTETCCAPLLALGSVINEDVSEDGEGDCESDDASERGEDSSDHHDEMRDVESGMGPQSAIGDEKNDALDAQTSDVASSMQGHFIRHNKDLAEGSQNGEDRPEAPVTTRGISTRSRKGVTWYNACVVLSNFVVETRRTTELSFALDWLVILTEIKQRTSCSLENSLRESIASVLQEHGTTQEQIGMSFRAFVTVKWWWFHKRRVYSPRTQKLEVALQARRQFDPYSAHMRGQISKPERRRRLRCGDAEWPAFYKVFVGIYAACGREAKGVEFLTSLKTIADKRWEHESMAAEDLLARDVQRHSLASRLAAERARRRTEQTELRLEHLNRKWLAREDKLSRRFNNRSHSIETLVRRLVHRWWSRKTKHEARENRRASVVAARERRRASIAARNADRKARAEVRRASAAKRVAQRAVLKERVLRKRAYKDFTMDEILRGAA
eukprot:TRINITY_DN12761_c0_g2_i1.p1 TRINITY_DN12761_c0_g2~~TRINITY_DN12761_c0_g2_i1.p1  ORF type:complete len:692 (-),score=60.60 TRINITY_DN12761_c0_g2_i1:244-2142(-)